VTFLSSSSSCILTRAEWTLFQTHCYSENLAAPGIEPGTSGSAARDSDHYITEAVNSATITNENYIHKENKRIIYIGNVCCHSDQSLLPKSLNTEVHYTNI
jgi:hypothetical protein